MDRLRTSAVAFRKIANGYTQKKYLERSSFLEFLDKDILTSNEDFDDDEYRSAKDEEVTDDDENGEENRRRTIMRIN